MTKEYIIIPINQTEGMYGYSAVAIEHTAENVQDLYRMVDVIDEVHNLDATVSKLIYANPWVDIMLFNDDFEPMTDKIYIEELEDLHVDDLCEEGECTLKPAELQVGSFDFKILYEAEHSDAYLFGEFTLDELTEVLKDN